MSAPKVYLAGPGVFRPNAKQIGEKLKALCARQRLEGLWPADNDVVHAAPGMPDTPFGRASFIYRSNLMLIAECLAVVADITPFRGPHMDCGTAFEIGVAVARSKPVFAYSERPLFLPAYNRPPHLIERIWCQETPTGWRDAHGDLVEDFGLAENLMIGCTVDSVSVSAEQAIHRCAQWLWKVPA